MKEVRAYELKVGEKFAIIYDKNILTFMIKGIDSVGAYSVVTTTSDHVIKFKLGDYVYVVE
jgi:hypothetical protein